MWKESTNKDVTSKHKNMSVPGLTDDEARVPHFKATIYHRLGLRESTQSQTISPDDSSTLTSHKA